MLSQNSIFKGIVTDNKFIPINEVNIKVVELPSIGATSDTKGMFSITIPSNNELTIEFSHIAFQHKTIKINLSPNEIFENKIILEELYNVLPDVEIKEQSQRKLGYLTLNPEILLKSTGQNFEDFIKLLGSGSSNNELSSQYNVRGGSYDENLIIVNDIEIYRPILIRSGNQEGLSFINSDMVSSLSFSAGGFEAKYGDKMSSVLDIKYKKPREFGGTFSASLLGGNAHIEGTALNNLLKYNTGIRYKTTRYLLNSMDMAGKYDPNYLDFQTYITYNINEKLELSFLGNINDNRYNFIPQTRSTAFGSIDQALGLNIYYEGQEKDRFTSETGAFTVSYTIIPDTLVLKFIVSGYYTNEQENFDIMGTYFLNELDNRLGSDYLGDSVQNIGQGKYLEHARNYLNGGVFSLKHIGNYKYKKHDIQWGIQYSHENMLYNVYEWNMVDSAGYSLPRNQQGVDLSYVFIDDFNLYSNKINIYIQDSYEISLNDKSDLYIGGGIRLNYWDFNNQFLVAPRFNIALKPYWKKDFLFRFSTGLYHQPPNIKEIRRLDATINYDIKAQSSYHFVLGSDYEFKMWNSPFKLVTELYYKYLYNINPYTIDNVRIKYFGENIAHGYATGFETKINGEFVKGTESWFSIGIMKTAEKIDGLFYKQRNEQGNYDTTYYSQYILRPNDQRLNLGIFFQDYLPGNSTWQASLSLFFGTSLPANIINKNKEILSFSKLPAYKRVDLGISKQILSKNREITTENFWSNIKEMWISLEIFNLLDISNTVSKTWITSTDGLLYGVPNYLTSRRLNLKFSCKF